MFEKVITEEFEFKSRKFSIPNYHIFRCDNCKEEFVSPKTLRATEKILTDFRRKVEGLLTSEEIKGIREKLRKTQAEMATWLGVGEKNFARYENGQVMRSKPMDLLLRILNVNPAILDDVRTHRSYAVLDMPEVVCCQKSDTDVEYAVKAGKYGYLKAVELAA